jgi:hypothetical protein
MRLTKYLAAAAALSLAAAPAFADPAASTAQVSRAHSHAKHKSDLLGGGFIIAIIAATAVVVGVVVVADNSSSN